MSEANPELKTAYQRLEEAIDNVMRLEDFQGVMTEWIVVTSTQRYEDGGITQVGTLVPEGAGAVPYHRLIGLLDYALTRMRAEVARDDD
ncbi:hypothetical protein [Streptomyces sp. NPDC048157]|uniref:hypothetical protein n=1 Tax=Streptomyces sp. NPDC048157 TaxID=3365503 RepID=UPI00371C87AB